MKKIIITVSLLILALGAWAQSKTVANFEKQTDGMKVFMYQSVIRMLNSDKNPDFNRLIADLDHLRMVLSEPIEEGLIDQFRLLEKGIQSEGYTEIMAFDSKENRCHVYELETSNGKSLWVATVMTEGRVGVLEMKGTLNLTYLDALSSLNIERLQELNPSLRNFD